MGTKTGMISGDDEKNSNVIFISFTNLETRGHEGKIMPMDVPHFYKNIKIDYVKYMSKISIPSSAAPVETSFLLPFCFSSIPPPTSRNPL